MRGYLFTLPVGRHGWRVFPLASIRAAGLSLLLILAAGITVEVLLANLERQSLVTGQEWVLHNQLIQTELLQKRDLSASYPMQFQVEYLGQTVAATPAVQAWKGHSVSKAKVRPLRILVLGDSFVAGSPYLTLNHQWWRQFAQELEFRGYHQVEVIAAGNPGFSTADQLQFAPRVVADFQPDFIVWGYVANDPDERVVPQEFISAPAIFRGRGWLLRCLPRLLPLCENMRVDKVLTLRARQTAASSQTQATRYRYEDWELALLEGDNFERYRQTVHRVGQFHQQSQLPGLMVTLPNRPDEAYFAQRYAPVLPLWKSAGIPTYDLLPAFVSQYPELGLNPLAWGINPADGHPGPRSCRFFAREVCDILERDFPRFLGSREAGLLPTLNINDWYPSELDVRRQPEPGHFRFTYPTSEARMLRQPLDQPTVLVSLEVPIALQEIRLHGAGLQEAQVWVSHLDPVERYDLQDWTALAPQTGNSVRWKLPLPERSVSVIRLRASIVGSVRELELELTPAQTASAP